MKKLMYVFLLFISILGLLSCKDDEDLVITEVTIQFVTNGGTSIEDMVWDITDDAVMFPTPVREGYVFVGWYLDPELTENFSELELITTEIIIFYAKWEEEDSIIESTTITFNSNGGSAVQAITQSPGTIITPPTNPTKEGFAFAGWYMDSSLTQLYIFTVQPATNLTLYAKWTPVSNNIVIIFNVDGILTTFQGAEGTPFTMPQDPTKEGFEFLGWTNQVNGTEYFTLSIYPQNNLTLYAKWEETTQEITVTFETYGGTEIPDLVGIEGTPFEITIEILKSGFMFGGWYLDETLTIPLEEQVIPDENITLYARWIPLDNVVTLYFDTLGGNEIDPIMGLPGDVISIESPQKEGYAFDGWYLDMFFLEEVNEMVIPENNTTFYAKWVISINLGAFIYDSLTYQNYTARLTTMMSTIEEGESSIDQLLSNDYGQIVYAVHTSDSENNFSSYFNYVYTDAYGNTYNYITHDYGMTYIAYDDYTDTYKDPYEFITTSMMMVEMFVPSDLSSTWFTKDGIFYVLKDNYFDQMTMHIGDYIDQLIHYQIYQVNDGFSIQIEYLKNQISYSILLSYTQINQTYVSIPDIPNDIVENEDLFTYYKDEGGGYMVTGYIGDETDIYIPSTYQGLPVYGIASNAFTDSDSFESIIIPETIFIIEYQAFNNCQSLYDIYILSNPPLVTGQPIVNPSTYLDIHIYEDSETLYLSHEIWGIYAERYEIIGSYNVYFDGNGGTLSSGTEHVVVSNSETFIEPPIYTRDGYMLEGFEQIYQAGTLDYTLQAIWVKLFVVTFDIGDGTLIEGDLVQYVKYGENAVLPTINKDGHSYDWIGQYENVTSDRTIYASWYEPLYTIYFLSNGGTNTPSVKYTYGEEIVLPAEPIREGYIFAGWYVDESYQAEMTISFMPDHDLYLYAKWIYDVLETGDSFEDAYIMEETTFYDVLIDQAAKLVYFIFIPTKSGMYRFESYGDNDTRGYLYDINSINLASSDDINDDNYNFGITYELTEGETYYLVARMYGNGLGLFEVNVTFLGYIVTYTFDTNGGTPVEPIIDLFIPVRPLTTKADVYFAGWYDNPELLGNPVEFPYQSLTDITLYAKWSEDVIPDGTSKGSAYPIVENEIVNVDIVTEGQAVFYMFIATASQTYFIRSLGNGDTYGVLYDDFGNQLDYNDDGDSDYNFYITFNLIEGQTYYIETYFLDETETGTYQLVVERELPFVIYTFVSNGGSPVSEVVSDYLFYPAYTEKIGYYFAGWYDNIDLIGDAISYPYRSESDITLYAKWSLTIVENGWTYETAFVVDVDEEIELYFGPGTLLIIKFTPTSTGYYTFGTYGVLDTKGELYDSDHTFIIDNDDEDDSYNFMINEILASGETYYIIIYLYSSTDKGICTFYIHMD